MFKINGMKKIILFAAVYMMFFITQSKAEDVWDGSVAESYAGGSGTEDDPYQISNGAELAKLAQDVNNGIFFENIFFKLTADITLNKWVIDENGELTKDSANLNVWIPVGDNVIQGGNQTFNGLFDGNGHEINGIYVNSEEKEYAGLFGKAGGVIKNLGITDSYIYGSKYCGGICGYFQGTISGCYNEGIIKSLNYAGGIVGYVEQSNIIDCYNTGNVTSNNKTQQYASIAGGIVGALNNYQPVGRAESCFNKGHIVSSGEAGGIAGYAAGQINKCYNEGNIEGGTSVGGLCGFYGGPGMNIISSCYNTGTISREYMQDEVPPFVEFGSGGIVGVLTNASYLSVLSCYNKGYVYGSFNTGGVVGKSRTPSNISYCYNIALVEGDSCIGGVVGCNELGTINQCYNIGQLNGRIHTGGVVGSWFSGDMTFCYYLKDENNELHGVNNEDVKGLIEGFTEDDFKNGKVAWLLNQKSSIEGTSKWFQNIDGNEAGAAADAYPVLDPTHGMVYATGECYNHITGYSNTYTADIPAHSGENGICEHCGIVIPVEPAKVDGFYQIGSIGELYWFAGLANGTLGGVGDRSSNASAVLTDNITVNEQVLDGNGQLTGNSASLLPWEPIGSKYKRFSGSLDGQGHIIRGIYCNAPEEDYQGLFGNLYGGDISNLGMEDCYIAGASYTGSLAGLTNDTEILNCYSTGTVNGRSAVGGLTGDSFYNNAYMRNCYFGGNVKGQTAEETGNITGRCEEVAYILNCYYVRKPENTIGGINGDTDITGNVEGRSEEEFASGEIAWLLNNKETENAVWHQNINTSGLANDIMPILDTSHQMVYPVYNCPIDVVGYSNTAQAVIPDHKAEDGLCIYCGEIIYTEPELIDDYYQISNAGELYWFAALVNGTLENVEKNNAANAVLVNDITINRLEFVESEAGVSVTNSRFSWSPIKNFIGTFDGNGHYIKGLYINTNSDYQGLFGSVNTAGGILKNIFLSESYIKGERRVGGIVGCVGSSKASVTNCHCDSYVIGTDYVGGIVGESSCRIEKCSNHGCVSGELMVGGIAGYCRDSILICYNGGKITGTDKVGGIVGEGGMAVNNCYNTSSINGETYVGGIVGFLRMADGVFNCHNVGEITGERNIGYIVGLTMGRPVVSNCYYINDGDAVGDSKAEGRSSDEFADGTVYALLNCEGNKGIWYQEIGKDLYPVLDFFVATGVQDAPQINEEATVDVYDMKGLLIRKHVDKEKALSGLPAGIYIVNNKKVVVEL